MKSATNTLYIDARSGNGRRFARWTLATANGRVAACSWVEGTHQVSRAAVWAEARRHGAKRRRFPVGRGTRGTTEGLLVMTSELAEIEDKIKRTKLSKDAREKARHELKKLRQMSPMSAGATVVRNYLDWLLSIPWNKKTKVKKDLKLAQEILDNDHFGLEKVKERIVEYLAVQQRANKLTGPILCLVGP